MSSLTVLNHEIHQVDSLYSLNDLHKASGGQDKHRPAFFLRNQETKDLVAEIVDEKMGQSADLHSEKSDVQIRTSVENSVLRVVKGNFGKAKQGAFACKEIVYRYAMWISPKFALAVIRVFDAFANGKLQPTQPQITSIEDLLNASLEQGKTATEICNQVTKAENISFGIGRLHGKGLNKRKKEKKILKELQAITLKWMQFKLPFIESKAV